MKQNYLIPSFDCFTPSNEALAVIRHFAYSIRALNVNGEYELYSLN